MRLGDWWDRARRSNATKNALRGFARKTQRRAEKAEAATAPAISAPARAVPADSVAPLASAVNPGAEYRLLSHVDKLQPGDERTRAESYADSWATVGVTMHGLSVFGARRVYGPNNAEGQRDPLYFRRVCGTPAPVVTILDEAKPGDEWRLLSPDEVIQPGDEWKCDGTGCPTYRTLNPHHGKTVGEVNALRSPDLPRIYRRKVATSLRSARITRC